MPSKTTIINLQQIRLDVTSFAATGQRCLAEQAIPELVRQATSGLFGYPFVASHELPSRGCDHHLKAVGKYLP